MPWGGHWNKHCLGKDCNRVAAVGHDRLCTECYAKRCRAENPSIERREAAAARAAAREAARSPKEKKVRSALLEIAVIAVGALLAFSVAASAKEAKIPEDYMKSVAGAVSDCGAKYGWAMATTNEEYSPHAAIEGCIRELGAYQTWLIKVRKVEINEASRIAVANLAGAYYGGYKAVIVSKARDRKEGKYDL